MKFILGVALVALLGCEADTSLPTAVHPLAQDALRVAPLGPGSAEYRFPAGNIPQEGIILEKQVMPFDSNQPAYPSFEF